MGYETSDRADKTRTSSTERQISSQEAKIVFDYCSIGNGRFALISSDRRMPWEFLLLKPKKDFLPKVIGIENFALFFSVFGFSFIKATSKGSRRKIYKSLYVIEICGQ